MSKDTYCSHCGKIFAEQKSYPRKCFFCGNDTWSNPIPVVVVIATAEWVRGKTGILIQQRNIEPKKGGWALSSGYVNSGETWQQAAARELQEEVNVVSSPDDFHLVDVDHSTNGNILIFCSIDLQSTNWYKTAECFVPNEEVQAIDFIELLPPVKGLFKSANSIDVRELAFPSHIRQAEKFIIDRINYHGE